MKKLLVLVLVVCLLLATQQVALAKGQIARPGDCFWTTVDLPELGETHAIFKVFEVRTLPTGEAQYVGALLLRPEFDQDGRTKSELSEAYFVLASKTSLSVFFTGWSEDTAKMFLINGPFMSDKGQLYLYGVDAGLCIQGLKGPSISITE